MDPSTAASDKICKELEGPDEMAFLGVVRLDGLRVPGVGVNDG